MIFGWLQRMAGAVFTALAVLFFVYRLGLSQRKQKDLENALEVRRSVDHALRQRVRDDEIIYRD